MKMNKFLIKVKFNIILNLNKIYLNLIIEFMLYIILIKMDKKETFSSNTSYFVNLYLINNLKLKQNKKRF